MNNLITQNSNTQKPVLKDTLDKNQKTFRCFDLPIVIKWREALALRYFNDPDKNSSFVVSWEDRDYQEKVIQVPLICKDPKKSNLAKSFIQISDSISNTLCITITLYFLKRVTRTKGAGSCLIQGSFCETWVKNEFDILCTIVEKLLHSSSNDTSSQSSIGIAPSAASSDAAHGHCNVAITAVNKDNPMLRCSRVTVHGECMKSVSELCQEDPSIRCSKVAIIEGSQITSCDSAHEGCKENAFSQCPEDIEVINTQSTSDTAHDDSLMTITEVYNQSHTIQCSVLDAANDGEYSSSENAHNHDVTANTMCEEDTTYQSSLDSTTENTLSSPTECSQAAKGDVHFIPCATVQVESPTIQYSTTNNGTQSTSSISTPGNSSASVNVTCEKKATDQSNTIFKPHEKEKNDESESSDCVIAVCENSHIENSQVDIEDKSKNDVATEIDSDLGNSCHQCQQTLSVALCKECYRDIVKEEISTIVRHKIKVSTQILEEQINDLKIEISKLSKLAKTQENEIKSLNDKQKHLSTITKQTMCSNSDGKIPSDQSIKPPPQAVPESTNSPRSSKLEKPVNINVPNRNTFVVATSPPKQGLGSADKKTFSTDCTSLTNHTLNEQSLNKDACGDKKSSPSTRVDNNTPKIGDYDQCDFSSPKPTTSTPPLLNKTPSVHANSHSAPRFKIKLPEPGKIENFILGDSNLRHVDRYRLDKAGSTHIRTMPGAKISDITNSLVHSLPRPDIKKVVVLVGQNDLHKEISSDVIKQDFADLFSELSRVFPTARIAISAFLPNKALPLKRIAILNDELHNLCAQFGMAFLFQTAFFHSQKVVMSFFSSDGVHLSERGLSLWLRNVIAFLDIHRNKKVNQNLRQSNVAPRFKEYPEKRLDQNQTSTLKVNDATTSQNKSSQILNDPSIINHNHLTKSYHQQKSCSEPNFQRIEGNVNHQNQATPQFAPQSSSYPNTFLDQQHYLQQCKTMLPFVSPGWPNGPQIPMFPPWFGPFNHMPFNPWMLFHKPPSEANTDQQT